MDIRRREFCTLLAGGAAALAGCSAADDVAEEAGDRVVTEQPEANAAPKPDSTPTPEIFGDTDFQSGLPDPSVGDLIVPDGQLVSIDQTDDTTFTMTIQNTGDAGNIAVALFWKTQDNATKPSNVGELQQGFTRERLQEYYFDSDERRTVEMSAAPPDGVLGYGFSAQPANHGAEITNHGAEGPVKVTFTHGDLLLGLEQTDTKEVDIGRGETETVMFDGVVSTEIEWQISAGNILTD